MARRGDRELDRPRVVQTSDQVLSILRRARAYFSKPPQPIVALVPNGVSLNEHRIAVATEPLRAWDTSVARRVKTLPIVPGELTRCRTNLHPAVKAVGLAVLVRSAGLLTQTVGAGKVLSGSVRCAPGSMETCCCCYGSTDVLADARKNN